MPPLRWMVHEATECGLLLNGAFKPDVLNQDNIPVSDSLKYLWWLLELFCITRLSYRLATEEQPQGYVPPKGHDLTTATNAIGGEISANAKNSQNEGCVQMLVQCYGVLTRCKYLESSHSITQRVLSRLGRLPSFLPRASRGCRLNSAHCSCGMLTETINSPHLGNGRRILPGQRFHLSTHFTAENYISTAKVAQLKEHFDPHKLNPREHNVETDPYEEARFALAQTFKLFESGKAPYKLEVLESFSILSSGGSQAVSH